MNILITGCNGQLGSELAKNLKDGYTELGPIPDALRDAQVQAVQRVVKVAGQQQTIKISHRGLLSPLGGAKAVFFQF